MSNNQGVKEKTFIQTSRRGIHRQPGGEDLQRGSSWKTGAGKAAACGPGSWRAGQGSSWQSGQGGGWWSRWSHICMQINQEKQLGSETDHTTQGSNAGKEILKTSGWKKSVRVEVVGETPSLTGEFVGKTHRVLEHTQNHPPRNQHLQGPVC